MKINRHNFTTVEKVKDGFVVEVVDADGNPFDLDGIEVRAAARVDEQVVAFELVKLEEPGKFGLLWPGFEEAGAYPYDVFLFDGHTEIVLLAGGISVVSRVADDFEGDAGGFSEVVTGVLSGSQIVKVIATDVQVCSPTAPAVTPVSVEHLQESAAGLQDNAVVHGYRFTSRYTGELVSLDLAARDVGALKSPGPKWLRVWSVAGDERTLLGESTQAVAQTTGDVSTWEFGGVPVTAGQQLAVTAHAVTGKDYAQFDRIDCRVRANTDGDGGVIIGADGLRIDAGWLPAYEATIREQQGVDVGGVTLAGYDDLARHAGDGSVHVTAAEKSSWSEAELNLKTHRKDQKMHVTSGDRQTWDECSDALAYHVNESDMHVTDTERVEWNGKAEATSLALHTEDAVHHITAQERTRWDAAVPASAARLLGCVSDDAPESTGVRVRMGETRVLIGTDNTGGNCDAGCEDGTARISANALSVAVIVDSDCITLRAGDVEVGLTADRLQALASLLDVVRVDYDSNGRRNVTINDLLSITHGNADDHWLGGTVTVSCQIFDVAGTVIKWSGLGEGTFDLEVVDQLILPRKRN